MRGAGNTDSRQSLSLAFLRVSASALTLYLPFTQFDYNLIFAVSSEAASQ
jgi:hypothetical protein